MTLKLNGVEIDDLRVNGVKADSGYLNGAKVYERISQGAVIDGDIVFGQMDGYWYLAAPASKRVVREWGDHGTDTSLPDSPNPDPNSGEHNTDVLVGRGSGKHPAAEYCRSLGERYDLPNLQELKYLHDNKAAIDAADGSIDGSSTQPTFANIDDDTARDGGSSPDSQHVWTSTEISWVYARAVDFSKVGSGSWTQSFRKYSKFWVVPVRRIRA